MDTLILLDVKPYTMNYRDLECCKTSYDVVYKYKDLSIMTIFHIYNSKLTISFESIIDSNEGYYSHDDYQHLKHDMKELFLNEYSYIKPLVFQASVAESKFLMLYCGQFLICANIIDHFSIDSKDSFDHDVDVLKQVINEYVSLNDLNEPKQLNLNLK